MTTMNTNKMRVELQAQLEKNIYKEPIEIVSMQQLDIQNSNLADLGDNFIAEKFSKQQLEEDNDFLEFNPLHLNIKTDNHNYDLDIAINGKKFGGFNRAIAKAIVQFNIEMPYDIETSLVGSEFSKIHQMDAHYLHLQRTYPQLAEFTPMYYGHVFSDQKNLAYSIEELIEDPQHLNECHRADQWSSDLLYKATDGISHLHAVFYNQPDLIGALPWLTKRFSLGQWQNDMPLWRCLAKAVAQLRSDIISTETLDLQLQCVEEIDHWYSHLEQAKTTIIHGDFNPRNLCFRNHQGQQKACILDWECAREHVPQFDLVQFVLYSTTPSTIIEKSTRVFARGLEQLNSLSNTCLSEKEHLTLCRACVKEHLISRIPLLIIIFKCFQPPFDYGKLLLENAVALLQSNVFKGL